MIFQFIALIVLLILSGFFSGSETAYTSLSAVQLQTLRNEGGRRGKLVAKLQEQPDILLGTILVGNNLVNIGASALATSLTIRLFSNNAVGITTGILTLIILVFGEVTPKRLAILLNEKVCLKTAPVIWFLSIVFRPVVILISMVSRLITRMVGHTASRSLTLQGILHIINAAEATGILGREENEIMRNVIRIGETPVEVLMTHRTEVFSLSMYSSIETVIDQAHTSGFSRIPVYGEHPEHVTGVVLIKDMMQQIIEGRQDTVLKQIMLEPIFVPQNKRADDMLLEFKRQQLNMAIVMDEYGGLAGVVTVEDIIEEIVGELYDEYDTEEAERISDNGDGSYLIMAETPIDMVEQELRIPLEHGRNSSTFGGYVMENLGHLPGPKERISLPTGEAVIEHVHKNRLISIRFIPHRPEDADHPE
ncbi:MAG: hemolysin family protein [Spirochaetales bacterium]|nr:hemolysin family protein [Spirochaetales bacterium]MCF7937377.1 hemolysin family protein [Spirochaetales bacterium]